jgi:hypothetical protein
MVPALPLAFQAPFAHAHQRGKMAGMLPLPFLSASVALALTCDDYAPAEVVALMKASAVNEASGLARSRTRPGVWFTHNDAGGLAELYAFSLDGTFIEAHAVSGAGFVDWEDLAAGPCPGGAGDCLYIGDIGDNSRTRASITVYAVREPGPGEQADVVASFPAFYPEGDPQDSEALFVHPRTGGIYLATKDAESDTSTIFRFHDEPTATPQELTPVAAWIPEVSGAATTGADWDADGDRLVIRTYGIAFQWVTDPCEPDAHWGQVPTIWPVGDSRGEAIAYDDQGDMVAITEGEIATISRLACASTGPGGGPCDTGESDTDTDGDTDTDTDTDTDSVPPADSDDSGPEPHDSSPSGDTGEGRPDGCGACGGCNHAGGGLLAALLGLAGMGRRRVGPRPS